MLGIEIGLAEAEMKRRKAMYDGVREERSTDVENVLESG